jgi:lipid II:glycine glycyltransferase (peptidoglycan interpeptide bridge formation enzyme)
VVVYRCLDGEGRLLAIRAAGLCGATAMDLLAVAGGEARKVYASHATLWALLDHCSRLGLRDYDLSGVDPVRNKGVFDFKHGTGASLVECLGEWEWASLPGLRRAVNWLVARKGA